jgi:hypothetical protein
MDNAALPPISEPLTRAIKDSGLPLSRIAREAGVPHSALSRFISNVSAAHRDILVEKTADKLAVYFGLELRPAGAKGKGKGRKVGKERR